MELLIDPFSNNAARYPIFGLLVFTKCRLEEENEFDKRKKKKEVGLGDI